MLFDLIIVFVVYLKRFFPKSLLSNIKSFKTNTVLSAVKMTKKSRGDENMLTYI